LEGLEVNEIGAMMAGAAGHELDPAGLELAHEIARETDGNPFFVAEMLRHLTESGAIVQGSDGRWELQSSIGDLGLPQSVREVICRRVERLGERVEQSLSVAAVVGRTFDVELLGLLVEGDEDELLDTLEKATHASLLAESPQRVGRFSFAHALINHALYDALGVTRRVRLHGRVAVALEELCSAEAGERLVAAFLEDSAGSAAGSAAILAHHWREAGETDRAMDYQLKAAEKAAQAGVYAEAVALYNQAIDSIPDGDAARRRQVELKRALAYARFSHWAGGAVSDAARARRGV
jgi:predicted ATPase